MKNKFIKLEEEIDKYIKHKLLDIIAEIKEHPESENFTSGEFLDNTIDFSSDSKIEMMLTNIVETKSKKLYKLYQKNKKYKNILK